MSTHFVHKTQKITKVPLQSTPYLCDLERIPRPPSTLYCLGTLPDTRTPSVAIIGTRKPTGYGKEVTTTLADRLARRGVAIISGLALGIDAIAHQATLDAGGTTIAILASGLHDITPRTNRQLGEAIIARGGALLSEYAPGVNLQKYQLHARNRLVAGLADCIIITEAAARSGTLNTAAHALEQGKDIYAVPGNITSPMSAGCNALIAQGAKPLTDIDELIEDLWPNSSGNTQPLLPLGSTDLENEIISMLASGVRDGDDLLAALHADPAEFNAALTMLEINGIIQPLGNNRWGLR